MENKKELDLLKDENLNLTNENKSLKESIENLKKDIDSLNTEKIDLMKSESELKLSLTEKDTDIENFKVNLKKSEDEKLENLLTDGIEKGKITNSNKVDFMELGYDKAKAIIENLPVINASLKDMIKSENKDTKIIELTFEDYIAMGKIQELKENDPALYSKLKNNN